MNYSEVAYTRLKQDILDKKLSKDSTVNVAAYTRKLNMSRTPVQEAIDALIEDGYLVRNSANKVIVTFQADYENLENNFKYSLCFFTDLLKNILVTSSTIIFRLM